MEYLIVLIFIMVSYTGIRLILDTIKEQSSAETEVIYGKEVPPVVRLVFTLLFILMIGFVFYKGLTIF